MDINKQKPHGYVIQVGDRIERWLFSRHLGTDVVTRVTENLAVCKTSEESRCYPRIVCLGFRPLPKRESQIFYYVAD